MFSRDHVRLEIKHAPAHASRVRAGQVGAVGKYLFFDFRAFMFDLRMLLIKLDYQVILSLEFQHDIFLVTHVSFDDFSDQVIDY